MEKVYLCPICHNGNLEVCSEALDSGECSSCGELSYFSETDDAYDGLHTSKRDENS